MRISDRFLTRLGRSRPYLPAVTFGPILLATFIYCFGVREIQQLQGLHYWLGWFVVGAFAWTLLEYFLHRFSFHVQYKNRGRSTLNPLRMINLLTSGVHGVHHKDPKHPDLIIAPPVLALPTYAGAFALFYYLSSDLCVTCMLSGGMIAGYLYYEWVHYSTHCRKARFWIERYQMKYHMVHHFRDPQNYFGVTIPFWDMLFGTYPKKIKV